MIVLEIGEGQSTEEFCQCCPVFILIKFFACVQIGLMPPTFLTGFGHATGKSQNLEILAFCEYKSYTNLRGCPGYVCVNEPS